MTATTLQAPRTSARTAVVGGLAAAAVATAIWAVATAAGVDFTVRFGAGQPIHVSVLSVVVSVLLASAAGWGLLVTLRRFTAKARAVWTVAAADAALFSLAGPLS